VTGQKEVRVRSNDAPIGRPRGALRRLLELLLYPVFQTLLLIPALRRWRRAAWWRWVRIALAIGGLALLAVGGTWTVLAAPGGVLLAAAVLLGPVPDPDRLRKIADALGSPHTLDGGSYAGGPLSLPLGAPVRLFLSGREVLAVHGERPEKVLWRRGLAGIEAIELDGRVYQPRYVSFAKEPPRREEYPDPHAVSRLSVRFASEVLQLDYRGVFAAHLAEIAARTLHDLRRLAVEDPRPAERLPVIGTS
jgi:hypothetical protein